jgi:hypothetical protein
MSIDALLDIAHRWKKRQGLDEVISFTSQTEENTGLIAIKKTTLDKLIQRNEAFDIDRNVHLIKSIDYDKNRVFITDNAGRERTKKFRSGILRKGFFKDFYVFNPLPKDYSDMAIDFSNTKVSYSDITTRHNDLWRMFFNRLTNKYLESKPATPLKVRPTSTRSLAYIAMGIIGLASVGVCRVESNPQLFEKARYEEISAEYAKIKNQNLEVWNNRLGETLEKININNTLINESHNSFFDNAEVYLIHPTDSEYEGGSDNSYSFTYVNKFNRRNTSRGGVEKDQLYELIFNYLIEKHRNGEEGGVTLTSKDNSVEWLKIVMPTEDIPRTVNRYTYDPFTDHAKPVEIIIEKTYLEGIDPYIEATDQETVLEREKYIIEANIALFERFVPHSK